MLRWLLALAAVGGAVYVAFGVLLYAAQERMAHLPEIPGRSLEASPAAIGLEHETLEITAEDGVRLHGWRIPHPEPRATVLFFHGNAGNISHRLDTIEILHGLGLEVVIFDYRGYGRSEGSPSEAGLYRDAVAAARWVRDELGIPGQRLVYHGRSLGGALAARAAREHPPAGLILESTLASAPELARDLYPFYPTRLLTRLEYATVRDLDALELPTLIIHSPDDEIIPFRHAEALLEAAPAGSELHRIEGDHNTGFRLSGALYTEGIAQYLERRLDPAGGGSQRASGKDPEAR